MRQREGIRFRWADGSARVNVIREPFLSPTEEENEELAQQFVPP